MNERLELLIGNNNINKLNNSTVLVLGVGGVGGYVVETLARSFIGTIILIDYDKIDKSNINRQIIALHSTIGLNKTEIFKKRILDINPNCNVIIHNIFYDANNKDIIFDRHIDFVIDACDSINSKKIIIEECLKRKIKFISCMGTGNKLDNTKFEIVDIRKTSYDPIAKIIRKWVKDSNIKEKVPVLYSKEEQIKNDSNVIGSISYVPSTAGLILAGYVIRELIKNL